MFDFRDISIFLLTAMIAAVSASTNAQDKNSKDADKLPLVAEQYERERVTSPQVTAEYLNLMADDYRRQAELFGKPPNPAVTSPWGDLPEEPGFDSNPPAGAQPHAKEDPGELELVRVRPERRKLSEPKRNGSADGNELVEPPEWRQIGFSSGVKPIDGKIDPQLLEGKDNIRDRDYTFAMVLVNEYLSPDIEERLKELGVELLDRHGSAHKARVPLDTNQLERIANEEFVEWIGYPDESQKVSIELSDTIEKYSEEVKRFPVYINLFYEFDNEEAELFVQAIRQRDLFIVTYHEDIGAVQAMVSAEDIRWLVSQDYVLYIELDSPESTGHDQSAPTIGADYIRIGGPGSRFSGSSTIVGVMDTGFAIGSAAPVMHNGLNKFGCGRNFTSDSAGVWNDQNDHGTHVLGTIGGTGAGDDRFRGVATGIGSSSTTRIRAAKIYNSGGNGASSWTNNGLEYMRGTKCRSGRPHVMNLSGGGGTNRGTDSRSRRVDANTWDHEILSVIISQNSGPNAGSATSPGNAKTSLTVGNVIDTGFSTVGDIRNSSGRGPTADNRMKPNIVAVGTSVMSTDAGTTNGYRSMTGTSMAAPHITGQVATLMDHYSWLKRRPYLARAHVMATALLHDDDVTPRDNDSNSRNTYGLGRASSYVSHWARGGSGGWSTNLARRTISNSSWGFRDITVPNGAERLVVVMTWDEDAASSGASDAVKYDLDLWVDRDANCTGDGGRQCGEWNSISYDDNVEYIIVDDPRPGTYRIKIVNWDAPSSGIPAGFAATVIRGDTSPNMSLTATAPSVVSTGSTFSITTTVRNPDYISSGVHIEDISRSSGLQFLDVTTTREDGTSTTISSDQLTLGNIRDDDSRTASWRYRKTTGGPKTVQFRIWSENAGQKTRTVTIN